MSQDLNRARKERNKVKFLGYFKCPLDDFWRGDIAGFDIIKFDQWLATKTVDDKDGYQYGKESMSSFIFRKYGEPAVDMLLDIIG